MQRSKKRESHALKNHKFWTCPICGRNLLIEDEWHKCAQKPGQPDPITIIIDDPVPDDIPDSPERRKLMDKWWHKLKP